MRRALLTFLSCFAFQGMAAESGVLRFWWNRGEVEDGQVNGIADRENFFPMLLDIRQFVMAWKGRVVCGHRNDAMVGVGIQDQRLWRAHLERGRGPRCDIKDVHCFYTFPKFDLITVKGGLK